MSEEPVITRKYSFCEIEKIRKLYSQHYWNLNTSAYKDSDKEWAERLLRTAMMAGLSVEEIEREVSEASQRRWKDVAEASLARITQGN